MSLEGVIEVEASVKQAHGTIVAADDDLASAAGTALDLSLDLIGNRALSRQFLLEELELPPLVHTFESILVSEIFEFRFRRLMMMMMIRSRLQISFFTSSFRLFLSSSSVFGSG